MDELNKNENEQEKLSATEAVEETDAAEMNEIVEESENEASEKPEDELMAELEGIREMLQNELDGNGIELIQELDEIEPTDEEADEEQVEKRICECCGENECDDTYGEDYPYCEQCRNLMKATPLRFTHIFTAIVMLAVAFFSLYFCTSSIDDYNNLLAAQEAYSQNNLSDAEYYYESYFSAKKSESNISRTALRNFLDISTKLGYLNYANQLIDDYFTEAQLKLPWNKKYTSIKDEYTVLVDTSTAINEVLAEALYYGIEFDLDEKLKELDAILEKEEVADGEGEKVYSEILVEYYKFAAMNLSNEKPEVQLEQLQKTAALDIDGSYEWLYLRNITAIAGQTGDVELTKQYADRCIELNKQEYAAYTSLADAYRYSGDIDAETLLEIAEKAEKATPAQAAPTYCQVYAMAYLLKGENEEALKSMEKYMDTQQYTLQSVNLYALCCVAANNSDGYDEAKSILESGGYDVAKVVKQFEKGKLTIEQVLADNGGEI